MSDRLDSLLSARLDDELTREELAELETLLAAHPEYAERARTFDELDVRLKAIAEESGEDVRLAVNLDGLRARLGFDVSSESGEPTSAANVEREPGDGSSQGVISLLGRPVVPLLLAAAAAILFYLVLPMGPPATEESSVLAETSGLDGDADAELDAYLEDGLVLVLGYGDEMSEMTGITSDDLDVIEQLDLLDFLSTRESVVEDTGKRG